MRLEEIARAKALDCDTIEIWFADEARVGQKNKITRRWAKRGTRPSAPRDQRTASTYIFGAVCPKEGKGAALIMPALPVALSMLVVGSAGYVYFVGLSSFLNFLNATPYYLFANYTLSVIPLFVLMGAFAERSGLARDLFALCSILVGRMRGGLGISVIGACSIFGAICGSSLATTATFSR